MIAGCGDRCAAVKPPVRSRPSVVGNVCVCCDCLRRLNVSVAPRVAKREDFSWHETASPNAVYHTAVCRFCGQHFAGEVGGKRRSTAGLRTLLRTRCGCRQMSPVGQSLSELGSTTSTLSIWYGVQTACEMYCVPERLTFPGMASS